MEGSAKTKLHEFLESTTLDSSDSALLASYRLREILAFAAARGYEFSRSEFVEQVRELSKSKGALPSWLEVRARDLDVWSGWPD
jgi:hypothetical protein